MFLINSRTSFAIAAIIIFIAIGCSGGGSSPTAPVDNPGEPVTEREPSASRMLWGIWEVEYDPAEMKAVVMPARSLLGHFNITEYVLPPSCDDCFDIAVQGFDPVTRILDADVTLRNPMMIPGHDVRGILYTNDFGHELTNADAWTSLWDIPGAEDINPFKAFAKGEPNRVFAAASEHMENYLLYIPLPPAYNKIQFAVDTSWPANCKEPYAIENFIQDGELYDVSGSMVDLSIDVIDWQDDVAEVTMACPFITGEAMTHFNQGSGNTWEVIITNAIGTPAGEYDIRLRGSSFNSAIPLYHYIKITISEVPPGIEVTAPDGNEQWAVGETELVTWISSGNIDNVSIWASINSGQSYTYEINPSTQNTGSYEWNPIPAAVVGENIRIRVMDEANPDTWDESDDDFTIIHPMFQLTAPNGGEVWFAGTDETITWTSENITTLVSLWYSTDDFVSDINPIAVDEEDDGVFLWTGIPEVESDTVKIRVGSASGVDYHDDSDADFTIHTSVITLTVPNGGEEWMLGSNHEITWESSGVAGNVNIYGSSDNFTSDIFTISEGEPYDVSYAWNDIDVAPSESLRVRVEWEDYPVIFDDSDSDFTIRDVGWGKTFGGPAEYNNTGEAVAADADGNVYSVGMFRETVDFDTDPSTVYNLVSNGSEDAFLSKHDSAGNFLWAHGWGGTESDYARDVKIDNFGNIYVCGSFYDVVDFDPDPVDEHLVDSQSGYDSYVVKFDADGDMLQVITWGSIGIAYSYGFDLDSMDNICIAGEYRNTADFDPGGGTAWKTAVNGGDAYLLKLDSSGNFQWVGVWGGSFNDRSTSVAIDNFDNPYVTGYFKNTVDFDPDPIGVFSIASNSNSDDVFINKLDSSGDFVWARAWGGTNYDWGNAIACDNVGNVYTTGYFLWDCDFDPDPVDELIRTSAGYFDCFLSAFDESGDLLWAGAWGGTGYDNSYGVVTDSFGNIYVTGYFSETVDFDIDPVGVFDVMSEGEYDIFLSKFDPTGYFEWVRTSGEESQDMGRGVAVDSYHNLYITGYFESMTIDLAPSDPPCFADPDFHDQAGSGDIFVSKYLDDGCW